MCGGLSLKHVAFALHELAGPRAGQTGNTVRGGSVRESVGKGHFIFTHSFQTCDMRGSVGGAKGRIREGDEEAGDNEDLITKTSNCCARLIQ